MAKKKSKYEALASLNVLISWHGTRDTKWSWAQDPKEDGLKAFFSTAAGFIDCNSDDLSLRNKAVSLSNRFRDEFTEPRETPLSDGKGVFKDRVVNTTKMNDDVLVSNYWEEAKPIALAILERLKGMDDRLAVFKYNNMLMYYQTAEKTFDPKSEHKDLKPLPVPEPEPAPSI